MPTYTGYRPYGQIASETVVTPAGAPFTGTLTLYAGATGPTTANAKSDATGAAISTVTVTSGVLPRFHIVEGGESWVDTGGGRAKLLPNDVGTKAGPAGEPGSPGSPGNTGPGVPAGGTTGQVLAKQSDQANATQWINLPGTSQLAATDTDRDDTTYGQITGALLFGAFCKFLVAAKIRWTITYSGTWPARTTAPTEFLSAGGLILWDSSDDSAAPQPTMSNGDDWLFYTEATA